MDSGLARHRVSMGMAGSDGMLGTAIFRFWAPNCSHVPSRPPQMDSGLARHRVSMGGAGSDGMLRHCDLPFSRPPRSRSGLPTANAKAA